MADNLPAMTNTPQRMAPRQAPKHRAAPQAVANDLAELQRLDIKAVSALTGRSPSSLREMVREGRFPAADYRDGSRCTRWNAGTVRRWLLATQTGQN